MYRLVALDLDGTTLNSNHELTQKTIEVLRMLSELGVIIAIATGRSLSAAISLLRTLQLQQELTPIVCCNGALGVLLRKSSEECFTNEVLFHFPLSEDHIQKILTFSKSKNCVAQYYHALSGAVYASPKTDAHFELLRRYEQLTGTAQNIVGGYEEPLKISPSAKIVILTNEPEEIIESAKYELPNDLNIFIGSPDPFFVEILSFSVSKGIGVKRICNFLSVDLSEVVAFGDGENDKEMLELAGYSCVPRNGKAVAKGVAKKVLEKSNDEDCVALELELLLEQGLLRTSK